MPTFSRPRVLRTFRRLIAVLSPAAGALFAAGCQLRPPLVLAPGEIAQAKAAPSAAGDALIEFELARAAKPGTEITLSAGGVTLPPLRVAVDAATGRIASGLNRIHRAWSAAWPAPPEGELIMTNEGPGEIAFRRVAVRSGLDLPVRRGEAPPPSARWEDVLAAMEKPLPPAGAKEREIDEISGLRGWMIRRQRRAAFEILEGAPAPVRLEAPLPAGVELRAARLADGSAAVALSRGGGPRWRALGPEWFPEEGEAVWQLVPRGKRMARNLALEGPALSLALFVGDPRNLGAAPASGKGAKSRERASVLVRLYGLDTPEPVLKAVWDEVAPAGRWMELRPAKPLPAGEYVLELLALKGEPSWLSWNRPRVMVPGTSRPSIVETLLTEEAAPGADMGSPLTIRLAAAAPAGRVESAKDAQPGPLPVQPPRKGAETFLDFSLLPGDTEIVRLLP